MANNKFNFCDIVRILSVKKKLEYFNGRTGIIRGISDNESDSTLFAYSVDILDENGDVEICKFIFEEDLCATGDRADKYKRYAAESVKVRVDPNTGEGKIIDDD